MIQFRMRKPCMEKTFRALGMIEPKYLFVLNFQIIHHQFNKLLCEEVSVIQYPQE